MDSSSRTLFIKHLNFTISKKKTPSVSEMKFSLISFCLNNINLVSIRLFTSWVLSQFYLVYYYYFVIIMFQLCFFMLLLPLFCCMFLLIVCCEALFISVKGAIK